MLHTNQATHDTQALLAMLQSSLRQNAEAQLKTRTRYRDWRAQPKSMAKSTARPTGSNLLMDAIAPMLLDTMLGYVFSSPLLSPYMCGVDPNLAAGVATGTIDALATPAPKPATEFHRYVLNDAVNEAQAQTFDAAMEAQDAQAQQLQMLQQMTVLLLQLLQQQQEQAAKKPELASDVLRHPQLARFKQNRHSIDCIRTAFADTADVVVPKFCGSRYTLAA